MNRSATASPSLPAALAAHASRGFTIVELLVVVSIMLGLFALILAGTRPNSGGEVRRAAQQFASLLLATQSRAIGDPQGAVVVLGSGTVQCTSVFAGDKPPFGIGTVGPGMPPASTSATSASVTITPINGGELQQGYRIQFFNRNPALPASVWFEFQPPETVSPRTNGGQSITNVVWPAPVGGQLQAMWACYPTKGPLAMEFPKQVAIDLRYSGTGDNPATTWGGLASKGDVAVSFDAVGGVDALMQGVGGTAAVRQPVEPIYFLVASRTDIEKDEALAEDRSLWVTIQPPTGRVTVSANISQTGKDEVAVRAARANARAAIAAGK